MSFLDLVKKRRSVRAYSDRPVSEADLRYVLEAARLAPSASNKQPWMFIIVTDAELRQNLKKVARSNTWLDEAPIIIAAVALEPDRVMTCQVPPYAVDLAIAVEHMVLAAADRGLGTCWIGAFDQDKAREILGISSQYRLVTVLPLGYPADGPRVKERKAFDEVVRYNRFE